MRRQRCGKILNISSVAAMIPIPFQAYYSAAKAAINSYTLALAAEIRPYGIQVGAIQPGDIKTGFTAARRKSLEGDDVYGGRIGRSISVMEQDEQAGMPPEAVARKICAALKKKRLRPVTTVGGRYRFICAAAKLLPASLLNRIVSKIYAA